VFRTLVKPLAIAALLLSALALGACGESSQDKAKAEVCSARSDISKQIEKLQGLTLSTSLLTEAKSGVEAIGKDLTKIKDAQPKLQPARKEQVEAATKSFETTFSSISSGLATALASGNIEAELKSAGPQVKAALSQLVTSYKQALAPINCS
jgi:hypothetical protein